MTWSADACSGLQDRSKRSARSSRQCKPTRVCHGARQGCESVRQCWDRLEQLCIVLSDVAAQPEVGSPKLVVDSNLRDPPARQSLPVCSLPPHNHRQQSALTGSFSLPNVGCISNAWTCLHALGGFHPSTLLRITSRPQQTHTANASHIFLLHCLW